MELDREQGNASSPLSPLGLGKMLSSSHLESEGCAPGTRLGILSTLFHLTHTTTLQLDIVVSVLQISRL